MQVVYLGNRFLKCQIKVKEVLSKRFIEKNPSTLCVLDKEFGRSLSGCFVLFCFLMGGICHFMQIFYLRDKMKCPFFLDGIICPYYAKL